MISFSKEEAGEGVLVASSVIKGGWTSDSTDAGTCASSALSVMLCRGQLKFIAVTRCLFQPGALGGQCNLIGPPVVKLLKISAGTACTVCTLGDSVTAQQIS